jgi:hypothetical protein
VILLVRVAEKVKAKKPARPKFVQSAPLFIKAKYFPVYSTNMPGSLKFTSERKNICTFIKAFQIETISGSSLLADFFAIEYL